MARGFSQTAGIDYNEVFSPVVKHTSVRILLFVVTQQNMFLEQLDVQTAFLHGRIEETIFMHQLEGFIQSYTNHKVCLLKGALYGLKQSPRQWYKRFDEYMIKIGFFRSNYDNCVYVRNCENIVVIYLLLYVDDMLVASTDKAQINHLKRELQNEFDMKNLGEAKRILGVDIYRNKINGDLFLYQTGYAKKVLRKFNMNLAKIVSIPFPVDCKLSKQMSPNTDDERQDMSSVPYASVVGSLMYIMLCTRPDLSHSISVLSMFMSDRGIQHWEMLKRLLRYLVGTDSLGLLFKKSKLEGENALLGYVDADYAFNIDNRRSQIGFVFTWFGTAVSWKSCLQHVVALSTTESEFLAVTEVVKEGV